MYSKTSDNQIDIRAVWAIIWRRKWLIIIPTVIVASVAFAGSYFIAPEFESSTIIQIEQQVPMTIDLQRLVFQQSTNRSQAYRNPSYQLRSILNEIRSLAYISLLDDRLKLTSLPEVQSQARMFVRTQPYLTLDQAALLALQAMLRDDIRVDLASDDQVRIVVLSEQAIMAKDIAGAFADIFISEKLKEYLLQVRSSQSFSDDQLTKYEEQLKKVTARKAQIKKDIKQIQLDPAISSESNLSSLRAEIALIIRLIDDLRQEEKRLLGALSDAEEIFISQFTLYYAETEKQNDQDLENQARQTYDLVTNYAWDDSRVFDFKVRANNLISIIEKRTGELVRNRYSDIDDRSQKRLARLTHIRSNIKYLVSSKLYMNSALDDISQKISLMPVYQSRLDEINNKITATADIRDLFKFQQESSIISQAAVKELTGLKYRIIEHARMPIFPVTPNRRKILLMGIILGLMLGIATMVLIELFDGSIKDAAEIEELVGLPVIGVMPKMKLLDKIVH